MSATRSGMWRSPLLLLLLGGLHAQKASAFAVCVIPNLSESTSVGSRASALQGVRQQLRTHATGFGICNAGDNSSAISGFDPDLWRRLFSYVNSPVANFQEAENVTAAPVSSGLYSFVCWTQGEDAALAAMVASNSSSDPAMGPCAVLIGGVVETYTKWSMGVRFAYPWLQTGYSVLTLTTTATSDSSNGAPDRWFFIRVLSWEVWLAIFLTLVCFPPLIWMIDKLNTDGQVVFSTSSIHDVMYRCFLSVFQIDVMHVNSTMAMLLVICLLLLNLIIAATFTASLTATLISSNAPVVSTTLTSVSQLSGIGPVAAPANVTDQITLQYNTFPTAQELETAFDWDNITDCLYNGSLSGYVAPLPLLNYWVESDPNGCDFQLLSNTFMHYWIAAAFSPRYPTAGIGNVTVAVSLAIDASDIAALSVQYLGTKGGANPCDPLAVAQDSSEVQPVSFQEISGLWIILACAAALAVPSMIFHVWKHAVAHAKRQLPGESQPLRILSAFLSRSSSSARRSGYEFEFRSHRAKYAQQDIQSVLDASARFNNISKNDVGDNNDAIDGRQIMPVSPFRRASMATAEELQGRRASAAGPGGKQQQGRRLSMTVLEEVSDRQLSINRV